MKKSVDVYFKPARIYGGGGDIAEMRAVVNRLITEGYKPVKLGEEYAREFADCPSIKSKSDIKNFKRTDKAVLISTALTKKKTAQLLQSQYQSLLLIELAEFGHLGTVRTPPAICLVPGFFIRPYTERTVPESTFPVGPYMNATLGRIRASKNWVIKRGLKPVAGSDSAESHGEYVWKLTETDLSGLVNRKWVCSYSSDVDAFGPYALVRYLLERHKDKNVIFLVCDLSLLVIVLCMLGWLPAAGLRKRLTLNLPSNVAFADVDSNSVYYRDRTLSSAKLVIFYCSTFSEDVFRRIMKSSDFALTTGSQSLLEAVVLGTPTLYRHQDMTKIANLILGLRAGDCGDAAEDIGGFFYPAHQIGIHSRTLARLQKSGQDTELDNFFAEVSPILERTLFKPRAKQLIQACKQVLDSNPPALKDGNDFIVRLIGLFTQSKELSRQAVSDLYVEMVRER